ncbi:hypothetical protein PS9374_02840 [Planomonospora sphaerica]|uniref:Uncharacterized protein n=1 Tax=Planomonospora sphaerica TaxID=161355 RepID=A0A171CTC5_9ACTN|nr:hypothetical protein PS9374_02840 [Planomonospora sphaerica]
MRTHRPARLLTTVGRRRACEICDGTGTAVRAAPPDAGDA